MKVSLEKFLCINLSIFVTVYNLTRICTRESYSVAVGLSSDRKLIADWKGKSEIFCTKAIVL